MPRGLQHDCLFGPGASLILNMFQNGGGACSVVHGSLVRLSQSHTNSSVLCVITSNAMYWAQICQQNACIRLA